MAQMQFFRGVDEDVTPDVRLTRSKDGTSGSALGNDVTQDVTGLYMIDEEGEIITREVNAKFINGKPAALEALYVMKSVEEWDRFMRFMERYAERNGLGFSKSS
jgi:photosystem II protein